MHLFKPTQCSRVNSNVNYGLWVMMTRQCTLINCNKCTTPEENVNNVGGYVDTGGRGAYRRFLYLTLNFAVNLRLL